MIGDRKGVRLNVINDTQAHNSTKAINGIPMSFSTESKYDICYCLASNRGFARESHKAD